MTSLSKLEATKDCIRLALEANGPMTVAELINEVKQQAFMSQFAYALSAMQYRLEIRIADDGAVELY